jgi:hypothetical protein
LNYLELLQQKQKLPIKAFIIGFKSRTVPCASPDGIFKGLEEGKTEIGYGTSVDRLRMSRDEIDKYTENMYNATKDSIE